MGVVERAGVQFEAAITVPTTCQGGSASQCWQLGNTHLVPCPCRAMVVEQCPEGVEQGGREVVGLNDATLGSNVEGGWHFCWLCLAQGEHS
jgi:hypothetical protein